MPTTNRSHPHSETQRTLASRGELIEHIAHALHHETATEPFDGLRLLRVPAPIELGLGVTAPSFCVIAQGSKEMVVGARRFRYDPAHYLICTEILPVAGRIVEASPEQPYLGLVLDLDPTLVGSVLAEVGQPSERASSTQAALDVSPLDIELLEDVVRLMRLVRSPDDARVLAPLIKREIVYRLLKGAQGDRLRQIASLGRETNRVTTAIARLRSDFDRPLRIDTLARNLGMSVSSLHHQFKAVTAMSPLQFQKQLRLQEARRLMVSEHLDATSAGFRVGYDDISHFNREYKRLFGAPPYRDAERMRNPTAAAPGH